MTYANGIKIIQFIFTSSHFLQLFSIYFTSGVKIFKGLVRSL